MEVYIKLTYAGTNTGPTFTLIDDEDDNYGSAFASGVAKATLLAGATYTVHDDTQNILIRSEGGVCEDVIFPVVMCTTTTTTTAEPTTTTTTIPPTTTTTTTAESFTIDNTDYGMSFNNYLPGSANVWEAWITFPHALSRQYTITFDFSATRNDTTGSHSGQVVVTANIGEQYVSGSSSVGLAQDQAEDWTIDSYSVTSIVPNDGIYDFEAPV